MTSGLVADAALASPAERDVARARFAPRLVPAHWPATSASRQEALERLTRPPFVLGAAGSQKQRVTGLGLLLDWLGDQPGRSWQERWMASGADAAGSRWRQVPAGWLRARGRYCDGRRDALCGALHVAICADVVRPSPSWFAAAVMRGGALTGCMSEARDPAGFARLRELCASDPHVSAVARTHILHRGAVIMGAKGGVLGDITAGDVLELLEAEESAHVSPMPHGAGFYRMLHRMGVLGPAAPPVLRELRAAGQRTPGELIDRYHIACRPVRDLLVGYLKERQPALDYSSLRSLAADLGSTFWKDLERHHPGIDSLHLPAGVAEAWKQRLRTRPKTILAANGETIRGHRQRISYRQCLTPVRAFYLDLAQWAIEDPGRWASGSLRAPSARKRSASARPPGTAKRAWTPAPASGCLSSPSWPARWTSAARPQRTAAGGPARAARGHLHRLRPDPGPLRRHTPGRGEDWADDPAAGKRRDLTMEEDLAFWAWATVEVLRLTGVRVEELLEISHYSLIRYRLPTTGELVPLLQITPSKTDSERLLVVSPELADVLSAIISRVRDDRGTVPLVRAYDRHECAWLGPSPFLFQRRWAAQDRRICSGTIRNMLNAALAGTGLTDADGQPLRYTPHDFRRIFITDAILSGLPPHIAQVIAGHRDINVTMGYKAVYPDEAIQAHLAFLARRRALRPTEEYRIPSDDEWAEFLGHFERRKVAIGTVRARIRNTRASTSTAACAAHALARPGPTAPPDEIRDNLVRPHRRGHARAGSARSKDSKISLAGAEDKLAQIGRRLQAGKHPVSLGMPGLPAAAAPRKELS